MTALWMVRAGRGGAFLGYFREHSCVAIGFGERAGVLNENTTKEELLVRYREQKPHAKEGSIANAASQLLRFHRELAPGDSVVTYDAEQRLYLLGTVRGEARFVEVSEDGNTDANYTRAVRWHSATPRDALTLATRNSLGSILTLFLVNESAAEELDRLKGPLAEVETRIAAPPPTPTDKGNAESFDDLRDETVEKASQFIEDKIAELDPYELQELVGGVLRAMGYKTRIAPPGPDRGIDIFASPDGLGLKEPRVFVEVKHRQAKMGSPDLRAFLGGRQSGDRCLYVSTGGFTQEARYEAERASVPLTLVDMAMLRQLVTDNYESLDQETRQLVPLTRLYWPIARGD